MPRIYSWIVLGTTANESVCHSEMSFHSLTVQKFNIEMNVTYERVEMTNCNTVGMIILYLEYVWNADRMID